MMPALGLHLFGSLFLFTCTVFIVFLKFGLTAPSAFGALRL